MAWTTLRWLNFRESLAYVTDGTNQVAIIGEFAQTLPVYGYPNVGTGNTVQVAGDTFEAGVAGIGSGVDGARNRNDTVDPRLAGVIYTVHPTQRDLQISMGAARVIDLYLALGDAGFATYPYVEIYDNTSLLATIDKTASPTSSGQFYDATGTLHTSAANWVSSNAPLTNLNISTGELIIRFGASSGSDSTQIATVGIQEVSASSIAHIPAYLSMLRNN